MLRRAAPQPYPSATPTLPLSKLCQLQPALRARINDLLVRRQLLAQPRRGHVVAGSGGGRGTRAQLVALRAQPLDLCLQARVLLRLPARRASRVRGQRLRVDTLTLV